MFLEDSTVNTGDGLTVLHWAFLRLIGKIRLWNKLLGE